MKRFIASIAAAGMLVAGAFVAVSATGSPADAQEVDEAATLVARGAGLLDDILDGLVSDGVIAEDQVDPIREAIADKTAELRAEREARRAERQETVELIRGFLDDDVIDADELAQLPDDHRWFDEDSALADALADGELTRDELKEARPDRAERGPRWNRGATTDDAATEETANA